MQKNTYKHRWTSWYGINDEWLEPVDNDDDYSDLDYMQAMAELAGCSMCDAESGNYEPDDIGYDVGDDVDAVLNP